MPWWAATSLDGVRFVPITGHEITLQLAWSSDSTSTALPDFLETARQTVRPRIG